MRGSVQGTSLLGFYFSKTSPTVSFRILVKELKLSDLDKHSPKKGKRDRMGQEAPPVAEELLTFGGY